jgi:hypothetical protein
MRWNAVKTIFWFGVSGFLFVAITLRVYLHFATERTLLGADKAELNSALDRYIESGVNADTNYPNWIALYGHSFYTVTNTYFIDGITHSPVLAMKKLRARHGSLAITTNRTLLLIRPSGDVVVVK